MKICQECGQKWYRLSSWRGSTPFRKDYWGFAIGPIMFIRKEYL